jgi:hypothetical protein
MRRVLAIAMLTAACSNAPLEGRGDGLAEPYPYTTPTPPATATAIDGEYRRSLGPDQAGGVGPCRRCPPYRLEAAESAITFDGGVFFVENEVAEEGAIDWRSIGHYTVDGDTVTLFNDPNCPQTRGTYRWALANGSLTLEVVDDDCAFGGLRHRYLTASAWTAAD